MSEYTKGDWDNLPPGEFICVCGREKTGLAIGMTLSDDPARKAEGTANGFLIVAAPKMFEALIDVRRALELANFTGELAVVDAAISKARGAKP